MPERCLEKYPFELVQGLKDLGTSLRYVGKHAHNIAVPSSTVDQVTAFGAEGTMIGISVRIEST